MSPIDSRGCRIRNFYMDPVPEAIRFFSKAAGKTLPGRVTDTGDHVEIDLSHYCCFLKRRFREARPRGTVASESALAPAGR